MANELSELPEAFYVHHGFIRMNDDKIDHTINCGRHVVERPVFLSVHVNPTTPMTSKVWPDSTCVSLTAFQFSPSINTLPPPASMREMAATVLPSVASLPDWTGRNSARNPAPTMKMKNDAVSTVAGM